MKTGTAVSKRGKQRPSRPPPTAHATQRFVRRAWPNPAAYDRAARDRVARLQANCATFQGNMRDDVRAAAISAAA